MRAGGPACGADALEALFRSGAITFRGQPVTYDEIKAAATSTYDAWGRAIGYLNTAGRGTKEQTQQRERFLTGTVWAINTLDNRAKYETAHDAYQEELDSAGGDPYAILEATRKYQERLTRNQSEAATSPEGEDANFTGAIGNELKALNGEEAGATPADLYMGTGVDDATISPQTCCAFPAAPLAACRTFLKVADIDSVFVTHHHDDHWFGLVHFPAATWFAAHEVADAINRTKRLPKPVEPAGGSVFDAIGLVQTPGHTPSHHSLRFICDGKMVVIAGDAVVTRKHWLERQGLHNSSDQAHAVRSIEQLSELADIVVPGHDNYFLNLKS